MTKDSKPSLDELAHYGVLGMKWGHHRKAATGSQIKAARRRLRVESKDYRKEAKKLGGLAEGSVKRAALETKLRDRHQAYLKNPDRVIAARMTRGEKFSSLFFGAETGAGLATSLATIAATSAVSRRIEFKQETGAYNKKSSGPVKKRIGFQTGRALTVAGAAAAPTILKSVGMTASSAIAAKAAANRNAAKIVKPSAIGSVAAKLKYAKVGRDGVVKITTMK